MSTASPTTHRLAVDGAHALELGALLLGDELGHLDGGDHGVADLHRRLEVQRLRNVDGAGAGELHAEHRRDVGGRQHAVRDALLEHGRCRVVGIDVHGIPIARDIGERRDDVGRHRVAEAGLLADAKVFKINTVWRRPHRSALPCLIRLGGRRRHYLHAVAWATMAPSPTVNEGAMRGLHRRGGASYKARNSPVVPKYLALRTTQEAGG